MRHILIAAALALASCTSAPEPTPAAVTLSGDLTRADHQTYREIPFTVPPGVHRIVIDFTYDKANRTVIDLGLRDPKGQRGWYTYDHRPRYGVNYFGLRNRKFQIEQLRLTLPEAGYVVSVARDFPKARMGLFDDLDRRYLDLLSGLAVTSLGHSHPAVAQALSDQAATLLHVSNLFGTVPGPQVAATLDRLMGGGGKVFFTNSGAEANECAIKLARKWGGRGKHTVISAYGSFHGRTLATVAAGDQAKGKYMVGFGGGPRLCLGRNFAQMQLRIQITTLLRRFHIEPDATRPFTIQGLPTHHPVDSYVHFRPLLAYQERAARYKLDVCEAKATQAPGGYVLNATKSVVPMGDQADAFIVPAKINSQLALFLVERQSAGRSAITQVLRCESRGFGATSDRSMQKRRCRGAYGEEEAAAMAAAGRSGR